MKMPKWIWVVLLAGSAAGCATPPVSQYYSLSPDASSWHANPTASNPTASTMRYAISVQPVVLPAQVDRPQIVISSVGSAQVIPLNDSLWVAPLSDELHQALSAELSQQLGVLDIAVRAAPETLPVWKVYVTVQRFDSVYNDHVVLEATWRLVPVNQSQQQAKICRAQATVPIEPGVPAVIAGHRQALHELASVIASQLPGAPATPETPHVRLKGCT